MSDRAIIRVAFRAPRAGDRGALREDAVRAQLPHGAGERRRARVLAGLGGRCWLSAIGGNYIYVVSKSVFYNQCSVKKCLLHCYRVCKVSVSSLAPNAWWPTRLARSAVLAVPMPIAAFMDGNWLKGAAQTWRLRAPRRSPYTKAMPAKLKSNSTLFIHRTIFVIAFSSRDSARRSAWLGKKREEPRRCFG